MNSSNPQQSHNNTLSQMLLKPRQCRKQTGSPFFRDTKVKTCAYIKSTKQGFKAIPFYDKRRASISVPSQTVRSWTTTVHCNKKEQYAGMGTSKSLVRYDPNHPRNRLYLSSYQPPLRNSSSIMIGDRSKKDKKHYLSTYNNELIHHKLQFPTSHPGIQAFRNKWLRERIRH